MTVTITGPGFPNKDLTKDCAVDFCVSDPAGPCCFTPPFPHSLNSSRSN